MACELRCTRSRVARLRHRPKLQSHRERTHLAASMILVVEMVEVATAFADTVALGGAGRFRIV